MSSTRLVGDACSVILRTQEVVIWNGVSASVRERSGDKWKTRITRVNGNSWRRCAFLLTVMIAPSAPTPNGIVPLLLWLNTRSPPK